MFPYSITRKWINPEQSKVAKLTKPYLLFDAGGTLVFPDQPCLIQLARAYGIKLTHEQLFNGYCDLIYTWDHRVRKRGDDFPYNPWPEGYACALLESIGISGPVVKAINQAVETRHRKKSLWTFTFSWVPEALDRLAAQGYRMSVISNSEDPTCEIFEAVGLAHYFEQIFHSAKLGVAKPDPGIFEGALCKLNLQPTDALYIGDIYEVDVRGANAAGIGGIHLDPLGLCADWAGVHLPDIRHLPNWLARYADDPTAFDLFPFICPESLLQCKNRDNALIDWSHSRHSQEHYTALAQYDMAHTAQSRLLVRW